MTKQNNFQKELDVILSKINTADKPKLLLHACCGPCSSYVLEYLYKYFQITVFYYNPNIYPQEEYTRRLEELKNLYLKFPPALEGKIQVIEENYNYNLNMVSFFNKLLEKLSIEHNKHISKQQILDFFTYENYCYLKEVKSNDDFLLQLIKEKEYSI